MDGEKCNVCGLLVQACLCGVEPPVCGRCSGRGEVQYMGSARLRFPCPECRPAESDRVAQQHLGQCPTCEDTREGGPVGEPCATCCPARHEHWDRRRRSGALWAELVSAFVAGGGSSGPA